MHLRPATIADSADLAILDDIAGHGLPSWLGRRAVASGRARHPVEWARENYAVGDGPAHWPNAMVAEHDGEVAGMTVGYAIPANHVFGEVTEPVLKPIFALFKRAAGSWLVDALAVYARFQRRGVARALLSDQIARAGRTVVHIVVADDNAAARALYDSAGFEPIADEPFVPFDETSSTRAWLLLQRPAEEQRT